MADKLKYDTGFSIIPDDLIEDERCNVYHIAVFCSIAKHANKEGRGWPSLNRLAKLAGASRRKVQDTVTDLEKFGWLSKEARWNPERGCYDSNIYVLAPMLQGMAPRAPGVWHEVPQGMAPRAQEPDPINHTQSEEERPPTAAVMSPMKDDLADHYQSRMTEVFPAQGWANKGQERRHLNTLAKRTRELRPLTPIGTDRELANAVLSQYMALRRKEKSEFWRNAPFTPSALASRWDQVTTALAADYEFAEAEERGLAAMRRLEG